MLAINSTLLSVFTPIDVIQPTGLMHGFSFKLAQQKLHSVKLGLTPMPHYCSLVKESSQVFS